MRNLIGKLLLLIADIILLVNFMMYLNYTNFLIDGFTFKYWDFNNYYFGVSSLYNWINKMPSSVIEYKPTAAIYNVIVSFAGANRMNQSTGVTIMWILGNLVFPISPTIAIINEFINLSNVFFDLINHVFKLFAGYYNIPIQHVPHNIIPITSWDFDLSKYLFIF